MKEAILAYVSERGDAISKADLSQIELMLCELPIEEVSDVRAWIMEGIALTVNDPLYRGDISPID